MKFRHYVRDKDGHIEIELFYGENGKWSVHYPYYEMNETNLRGLRKNLGSFREMKIIERIADYIKSWIYYPTMEKYFDDRNMSGYNRWKNRKFARYSYAWWHCHVGKLKNN